jgi:hypothetical protein
MKNRKDDEENDKTLIFKTEVNKTTLANDDRTRLEQVDPGFNEANSNKLDNPDLSGSTKQNHPLTDGNSISKNDSKKTHSATPNSVSPGVFAGSVVGAAAIGVIAGTVYSEEIKSVFSPQISDKPESIDNSIHDITDEAVLTNENLNFAQSASDSHILTATSNSTSSEFMYQFSNENSIYVVNTIDYDSDGDLDSLEANALLIDGSQIRCIANGNALDSIFKNNTNYEIAGHEDYITCCSADIFTNFGPQSLGLDSYKIQYGDTLSEIAESHNTSIVDLMALNPHISDPNVIFSGESLLIPVGDQDTNVYAGWVPNQPDFVQYSSEEINVGQDNLFYPQNDTSAVNDGLNEHAINDGGLTEYESLLSETDFYSMETSEYFLTDNSDLDSICC